MMKEISRHEAEALVRSSHVIKHNVSQSLKEICIRLELADLRICVVKYDLVRRKMMFHINLLIGGNL